MIAELTTAHETDANQCQGLCKICGSASLALFAHTAKCRDCGVLLYYPYPEESSFTAHLWSRREALDWYADSSFYNHHNFTNMIRFVTDRSLFGKQFEVLDYGGGGGQFSLVFKSHFPESNVHITDISDYALLREWSPLNTQIPFHEFDQDDRKFDLIFLNDVFEHVSMPLFVLKQLAGKLNPGGRIFIDTPKQFWIYPITKLVSKSLYAKVLKGTVSKAHLQIWSKKSFELISKQAGLRIMKYKELSEFTLPPRYYLKAMQIENPLMKLAGHLFYRNAKWLAKNKIMCVLSV